MLADLTCSSRRRRQIAAAITLLLIAQPGVALQYKVGDLDSWGAPPPSFSRLYASWALDHHFHIGDSLLFLYPPSQDSVVQVTEQAFNACAVADPILKMNDGNSIFNLTVPGRFYFTSGVPGRCEKRQKIQISVLDSKGGFFPPSSEAAAPAAGPTAYPLLFGPSPPEGSESPSRLRAYAGGGFALGIAVLSCLF